MTDIHTSKNWSHFCIHVTKWEKYGQHHLSVRCTVNHTSRMQDMMSKESICPIPSPQLDPHHPTVWRTVFQKTTREVHFKLRSNQVLAISRTVIGTQKAPSCKCSPVSSITNLNRSSNNTKLHLANQKGVKCVLWLPIEEIGSLPACPVQLDIVIELPQRWKLGLPLLLGVMMMFFHFLREIQSQ